MSTPETAHEQIERVEMMAEEHATWDLSDNDRAALCTVLQQRAELLAACQAFVAADEGPIYTERERAAINLMRAAIDKAEGKGQAA